MYRLLFALLTFSCFASEAQLTLAGTYKKHVEDDLYSTLIVEQHDKNNVYIAMSCHYGSPNFNSGIIEKTLLPLNGNTVRYHAVRFEDNPCTIDIEFADGQANVTQTEGHGVYCGFGMKVMCDGVFSK